MGFSRTYPFIVTFFFYVHWITQPSKNNRTYRASVCYNSPLCPERLQRTKNIPLELCKCYLMGWYLGMQIEERSYLRRKHWQFITMMVDLCCFFFKSPKLLCLKHLTQALDKCIILHLSHFPQTGPSDQKAVIMFDMFALRVKCHIYADMWTLLFHGVDEGLHAKASTKQKQTDICEKHQKRVCFHCQTTLRNSHISEILTLKSVLSSLPSPDRASPVGWKVLVDFIHDPLFFLDKEVGGIKEKWSRLLELLCQTWEDDQKEKPLWVVNNGCC